MIRYIVALALFVTLASACCYPNQFHGYIGTGSHFQGRGSLSSAVSLVELWYDHCNNRVRYDIWSKHFRGKIIYNYRLNEMYFVHNGTCRAYPARGKVQKMCTRRGANWLGNWIVGNTLMTYLYGNMRKSNHSNSGSFFAITPNCVPVVQSSYYKTKTGFSTVATSWTNIKLGISDLHAFDRPPNCKGRTRAVVNEDLDVQKVLDDIFTKKVTPTYGKSFAYVIDEFLQSRHTFSSY